MKISLTKTVTITLMMSSISVCANSGSAAEIENIRCDYVGQAAPILNPKPFFTIDADNNGFYNISFNGIPFKETQFVDAFNKSKVIDQTAPFACEIAKVKKELPCDSLICLFPKSVDTLVATCKRNGYNYVEDNIDEIYLGFMAKSTEATSFNTVNFEDVSIGSASLMTYWQIISIANFDDFIAPFPKNHTYGDGTKAYGWDNDKDNQFKCYEYQP